MHVSHGGMALRAGCTAPDNEPALLLHLFLTPSSPLLELSLHIFVLEFLSYTVTRLYLGFWSMAGTNPVQQGHG